MALVLLCLVATTALAQVCAPPSLLLTAIPPGGLINDYYDGSAQAALNPGASSLTLGTRDTRGYTTTLVVGDLLMVMQMQDGTINSSNNNTYGDGSGSGNGATSVGNAGLYEFVRITAIAGANVSFTPQLTNRYQYQDATASAPQKRYQVIRTLQFASVTTTATVVAPAWNGKTGGVVAMDVRDTLTLTNQAVPAPDNAGGAPQAAIFVAGKGFRGGLTIGSGASTAQAQLPDYARNSGGGSASKGEGFIGTPKTVAVKTNGWGFQTTNPPTALNTVAASAFEGYPGGSYGVGAPGNAGGGGMDGIVSADTNQYNAGGGGGGNYGPGGVGGRPWNFPLVDSGGRGGAGYAGTLAFNRVFMGGGGGAGDTNNSTADAASYVNQGMACAQADQCSSGAAGGGVVIIRAGAVTGSGVIDARGAHGYNVTNDAAGGGGAGGSVVIETTNGGNATINVTGGDGGNAWAGAGGWPGARHGPGGAGGGGFIAYAPTAMAVIASVNGGAPGQTMNDAPASANPEYYGSSGFNGGITTFLSPNVPGSPQAAKCDPKLALTKNDGVVNLSSPGTTTYTLTITNNGASTSTGTITVADKMTTALSVTAGTLTLSGANAAQWTCVAANATDITCTSTTGIPAGASRSFAYTAAVLAPNGSSIINRAQVSGGGDPLKATTATVATAATCTGTDAPLAGCALDTDAVMAPSLVLVKTNNVTQVAKGTSTTYTLTISNAGGTATSGTLTMADVLPVGMAYSGATPFTMNSFTCNVGITTTLGQGIVCDRGVALAAGSTATITFTVSLGAAPPSAVTNKAKVGGGGDPSPNKSTRPTTATAALCAVPVSPAVNTSEPDTGCSADTDEVRYVSLDLTKDDGTNSIQQGQTVTYKITVRNIGTIATTGQINFRDVLPTPAGGKTMTFVNTVATAYTPTGTNGANWSCTPQSVTTTVCVSQASIAAGGSSTFNLLARLTNTAVVGTQTLNKARVGGGGDVSTSAVNSPTTADVTACVGDGNPYGCAIDLDTVTAASPIIRMSKSHVNPQAKSVGNSFTFTLVVTNTGPGTAAANTIRMIDNIPAGLTINAVSGAAPFAGTNCGFTGRTVTCINSPTGVVTMAPNASATISVGVTVAAGATNTLVNTARIGATGDSTNSTLPTTTTAAVCTGTNVPFVGCAADTVPLTTDLQILKQQKLASTGTFQTTLLGASLLGTVQFQIQMVNPAGSAGVSTVTFSDTIPNQFGTVTTVSATDSGSSGCTATVAGNLVSGQASSLAPGSTCTVVVQAVAGQVTTGVTNTAVVSVPSGISDTNAANNSAQVVTAIGAVNLTVAKTNGLGTVTSGGTTAYTITVANLGPSDAGGTLLGDPVATGLSCTSVSCSATAANMCPATPLVATLQTTGLSIGPLFPAGSSAFFVVTCTVTATGL